jgi:hypothetical protein
VIFFDLLALKLKNVEKNLNNDKINKKIVIMINWVIKLLKNELN